MAITVTKDNLQLIEADKIFIDMVSNNITLYGQIPYNIPQKMIIDIIKISARLFYRLYWKSTQKFLYRIQLQDIVDYTKSENALPDYPGMVGYQVKLPGYIALVKEVYETNVAGQPTSQELIENVQLLQRSAPYGQTLLGINNALYIMEAGCRMIEENNYNSIFGTSVPFNFQPLTKIFHIKKKLTNNIVLETEANVDIQYLYQDDLFYRHVVGRTKQELLRLIGGHTFPLSGGGTINAENICNNLEDITVVEDILKNSSGVGDIILQR